MSKPVVVISTVGQSVLVKLASNDLGALRGSQGNLSDIRAIAQAKHDFMFKNVYDSAIAQLHSRADESEFIRTVSAELNSLDRILECHLPLDDNSKLHFFVSETVAGALAGRVIADFARERFGTPKTTVHIIEGLQVDDGRRFRLHGLSEVIRNTYKILNSNHAHPETFRRIINPTGGFKAVIPYMTIIGMLEGNVEMSYIYEHSSDVITLGSLPVRMDFEAVEASYDALNEIDFLGRRTECDEVRLRDLLEWHGKPITQHPLWSLLEVADIDGMMYYTLSGLGEIALQHFRSKAESIAVYISQQVKDKLDSRNLKNPERYHKYLEDLMQKGWFERHRHEYKNPANATALKVFNTNERVWAYHEGDYILVAELTYHRSDGSYETVPQNRRDYVKVERWEGNKS